MKSSIAERKGKKLIEYSKKDKRFDDRKYENQDLMAIFNDEIQRSSEIKAKFGKYPKRLFNCARSLFFSQHAELETGEAFFKLASAEFCRIRHCPICQSRLSMKWTAKFHQIIPKLEEEYPNTQFILMTLTVKNCEITELRKTIQHMNTAWNRMTNRAFFKKQILGFIRATEVTRNIDNNTAHPHFHILLHVRNSYFAGINYIKRDDWLQYWRDAMRDQTITQVDVRKVRESKRKSKAENLIAGALEVVKYATKHDNIANDAKWFIEYAIQVDRLRFMATGGTLKGLIADLENDDLINIEEDGVKDENLSPDEGFRLAFDWDGKKHYRRNEKKDYIDPKL